MQVIRRPFRWPETFESQNSTGFSPTGLFTSGHRQAWVVRLNKSGTIRQVHIRLGSITTPEDLRFSIQGLTTSLVPDGTDTHYVVAPTAAGDANTWFASGHLTDDGTGGGAKKVVAAGDVLAFVLRFESTVGNLNVNNRVVRASGLTQLAPANFNNSTNGGSSYFVNIGFPAIAVEYDDGTFDYQYGCLPAVGTIPSLTTSTSPDEYSIRFKLPGPATVSGLWWNFGTRQLQLSLRTDGGSILRGPISAEHTNVTAGIGVEITQFFASRIELDPDTWYRIFITPTGISGIFLPKFTLGNPDWAPIIGLPSDEYMVQFRTSAGAWTDDPGVYIPIALLIDAFGGEGTGGGPGAQLPNGIAVIPPTCL